MKRVFLFLVIGLICTIGVTSCEEENKGPGNVPLTDIIIQEGYVDGVRGGVRYADAVVTVDIDPVPANATDVDFKWESQNTSVATVAKEDGKGRITIRDVGSTVVVVSSGQVRKEIKVEGYIETVYPVGFRLTTIGTDETGSPVTVTLAESDTTALVASDTLEWVVGNIVDVTAVPDPVNANTPTADFITFVWTSDNEAVAKVDQTGKITVTGEGYATITVSGPVTEDGVNISVKIAVKGVKADEDES